MSATKPNGMNPAAANNDASGAARQTIVPPTSVAPAPLPGAGRTSAKSAGGQPATTGANDTANDARPEAWTGALQNEWLREQLGRRLTVRLSDGKTLTGTLKAYDPYTLKLQVDRQRPAMLIYKQHIAYLRAEERA